MSRGDRWYDPKAGPGLRLTVVHRDGSDLREFGRFTKEGGRWASLAALRAHYASYPGSEHIEGGVRVPRTSGLLEDITVEG